MSSFAGKVARGLRSGVGRLYNGMVINLYVKPRFLAEIICHPSRYCSHKSYFPERKRHSAARIWWDQAGQILRNGEPNIFYFPYGFDVKNKEERKAYIMYAPFAALRDKRNNSGRHSATAVLRDKFLFNMFTSFLGVESSASVGVTQPDGVFDVKTKMVVSVNDFFAPINSGDLFIKPIDGECGAGIIHLTISDGQLSANGKPITISALTQILTAHRYLIQTTVSQHPLLSKLHPQSINTIRLVTIRNQHTGQVEVFPSILRIGTGESFVDNTSQGGLAVGIDLTNGQLMEYGYYKPEFGTRVDRHPDTDIRFSDVTLPHFDLCKSQAILLHSMLPGIQSIGWDIAIGPAGPIFIEGNDNWEINGPQICNGGLKERFLALLN